MVLHRCVRWRSAWVVPSVVLASLVGLSCEQRLRRFQSEDHGENREVEHSQAQRPRFTTRKVGPGTFEMTAVPNGFVAKLDASGIALGRQGEDWRAHVSGARYGCEGAIEPLELRESPHMGAAANRVEYSVRTRSAAIDEWYINGTRGIEQGFTLATNPCVGGGDTAVIEVAFDGMTPTRRPDGNGLDLGDESGLARARYSELWARDATGALVQSRMDVNGSKAVLRINGAGAAWPIVVDPLIFVETGKLVLDGDAGPNAGFGYTVAISNTTALVGPYVFAGSGPQWSLQQLLKDVDGGGVSSSLVAIDGDTAMVGPNVYVRTGSTWALQQVLVGAGGWDAISGDTILYGNTVFVRAGTTWTLQQTLPAPLPGPACFGCVGIDKNTAIVGNQVFVRSGTTWALQQALTPNPGGESNYGDSAAISGDTAVVGMYDDSSAGLHAVYVFVRSGTTWTQQQRLTPNDTAGGFGDSVAIVGDRLWVAAWTTAIGTINNEGAVYVFSRSNGVWSQTQKLVPNDGAMGTGFGYTIALGSTNGIVGTSGNGAYVETLLPGPGSACTADSDCVTATGAPHCVDSVCCDTPCTSPCQACTAALKQSGPDGICGPAAAGTNPHHDPCAVTPASTCGTNGQCDGAGACQKYVAGTACGTTCLSNAATSETCNGTGTCTAATADAGTTGTPCAPGLCSAGACTTSCTTDSNCDPSAWCNAGTCTPKSSGPTTCTASDQCATKGGCVDGFCCDALCDGQCQACDLPSSQGTCTPVTSGQPHGTRAPCAGQGTPCAGTCGVATTSACQYPSSVSCGTTCSNANETSGACDGLGGCTLQLPTPCPNNLACTSDGTACKTACASDTDCAPGFGCTASGCAPKAGAICSGPHTSQNTSGGADAGVQECAPYVCNEGTGACLMTCKTVKDCVSPTVCDPSGACVFPTTGAGESAGGCSVGAAGRPCSSAALFGALPLFAVVARRRRRARQLDS